MSALPTPRRWLVVLTAVLLLTAGVGLSVVGSQTSVSTTPTASTPAASSTACASGIASASGPVSGLGALVAAAENATAGTIPDERNDTTVAYGDIAAIPLSVPAGTNATVTVDNGTREMTLSVRDDGDGRLSLQVNTYAVDPYWNVSADTWPNPEERSRKWNSTGTGLWASGADTVTSVDGPYPLVPGNYSVTVATDSSIVDEATLTVTRPVVRNVTVRRGYPQLFDASDETIRLRARNGALRPLARTDGNYPSVVDGETVVATLDSPTLLGILRAQPGETPTERLRQIQGRTELTTPLELTIYRQCGGYLLEKDEATDAVRVVPDRQSGVIYVVLDTAHLALLRNSVHIERPVNDWLLEGTETYSDGTFSLEGVEQSLSGLSPDGWLSLTATSNATIVGQTNLPPGSELPVVVQSRLDPSLSRTTTATVEDDGVFTATVDLETAASPHLFAVRVGEEQYPAAINRASGPYWLSHVSDLEDDPHLAEGWLYDQQLPRGGFFVVYKYADDRFHRVETIQGGDRYSHNFRVSLRGWETLRQFLVVPHRDVNDNGEFDGPSVDEPYRVDGQIVQGWAAVDFPPVQDGARPPVQFDPDLVGEPVPDDPQSQSPTNSTTITVTSTPSTIHWDTTTTTTVTWPYTGNSTTTRPSTVHPPTSTTTSMHTEPEPAPPTTTGDGPGFTLLGGIAALLAGTVLLARRRL